MLRHARRFGTVLWAVVLVCATSVPAAPPSGKGGGGGGGGKSEYQIVNLGTLGGDASEARAVNEFGQVAGWADTATGERRAFLWTPDVPNGSTGGMIDLGALPGDAESLATDVNNLGQVVGQSGPLVDSAYPPVGADRVFRWTPGGPGSPYVMVDLGTLGGPSHAEAINEEGAVVGWSWIPSEGVQHAFVWEPAAGMIDLNSLQDFSGTLPAQLGWTLLQEAYDSNDTQIVGSGWIVRDGVSENVPFLYVDDDGVFANGGGVFITLDNLPALEGVGYGLSSNGSVAGTTGFGGNSIEYQAFLWMPNETNGFSGMGINLGVLGRRAYRSAAYDVNDRGQAVGWSETERDVHPTTTFAFLWENGKMRDLGGLVPSGSGWVRLYNAWEINSGAQIVGGGVLESGQTGAFMITPSSK